MESQFPNRTLRAISEVRETAFRSRARGAGATLICPATAPRAASDDRSVNTDAEPKTICMMLIGIHYLWDSAWRKLPGH